jgi:hypothetical protein
MRSTAGITAGGGGRPGARTARRGRRRRYRRCGRRRRRQRGAPARAAANIGSTAIRTAANCSLHRRAAPACSATRSWSIGWAARYSAIQGGGTGATTPTSASSGRVGAKSAGSGGAGGRRQAASMYASVSANSAGVARQRAGRRRGVDSRFPGLARRLARRRRVTPVSAGSRCWRLRRHEQARGVGSFMVRIACGKGTSPGSRRR